MSNCTLCLFVIKINSTSRYEVHKIEQKMFSIKIDMMFFHAIASIERIQKGFEVISAKIPLKRLTKNNFRSSIVEVENVCNKHK